VDSSSCFEDKGFNGRPKVVKGRTGIKATEDNWKALSNVLSISRLYNFTGSRFQIF